MKLSTVVLLLGYALAGAVNLVPKQAQCSEDNCYRAVWGTDRGPNHPLSALTDCQKRLTTTVGIYPVTTITIVARNTTTAIVSCSTTPISSLASTPSTNALSPPDFTFPIPTPTPTPAGSAIGRVTARQNKVLFSSTTIEVGPIPTYAGGNCFNSGSVYASVCLCKGVITPRVLTELRSTVTSTDTLTITATVTSAASCSTSFTVSQPQSSSITVTTVTATLSTGTGTIHGSSVLSSSSSNSSFGSTSSSTSSLSLSSSAYESSTSSSSLPSTSSSSSLSSSTTSGTTAANISSTSAPTHFTSSDTSTTPSTFSSTSSTTLSMTSTSSTTSIFPTPTCLGLGEIKCDGKCLDARADRNNCGSCGNLCASGTDCINGVCARQPCDSTCTFNRFCNTSGPDRPVGGCICATDASNHGICFDKEKYQCGNSGLTRCLRTELSDVPGDMGCPLGEVCIKSICASNCNSTGTPEAAQFGVCVSTDRCGNSGTTQLGPLVRIGEQEKRRRLIGEFNW